MKNIGFEIVILTAILVLSSGVVYGGETLRSERKSAQSKIQQKENRIQVLEKQLLDCSADLTECKKSCKGM